MAYSRFSTRAYMLIDHVILHSTLAVESLTGTCDRSFLAGEPCINRVVIVSKCEALLLALFYSHVRKKVGRVASAILLLLLTSSYSAAPPVNCINSTN